MEWSFRDTQYEQRHDMLRKNEKYMVVLLENRKLWWGRECINKGNQSAQWPRRI